jgi:hypothetical protein
VKNLSIGLPGKFFFCNNNATYGNNNKRLCGRVTFWLPNAEIFLHKTLTVFSGLACGIGAIFRL